MGVEDREWWRDAQKAREQQSARRPGTATRSTQAVAIRGAFGIVVFWLVLAGALYLGFSHYESQRKAARAPYATEGGALVVPRGADGHFRLPGSVNGHAVEFLVDTGASLVTVSDAFARRAGLGAGQSVTFQTANGTRQGRVVRDVPVSAGHLGLGQAVVGVGLDTGQDIALLGQSFLARFDMEVTARQMVVRLRQP